MKLTRISDIDKLPNGTYSNKVTSNFTFTSNARKVLIKELFALNLHTKQEYYSVAEIMKVIEQYKATLNKPNEVLPETVESFPLDLPTVTESIPSITKEVIEEVIKESIITPINNPTTEEIVEAPKEEVLELLNEQEELKPLNIKRKRS